MLQKFPSNVSARWSETASDDPRRDEERFHELFQAAQKTNDHNASPSNAGNSPANTVLACIDCQGCDVKLVALGDLD
jgi:hypothetical protein